MNSTVIRQFVECGTLWYTGKNLLCTSYLKTSQQSFACRLLMKMTSGTEVQHDVNKKAFYMQLEKDHIAKLEYEWVKDDVIDLYHTEVPSVYQGKGLAKHLAKAALDYAVSKDAKIILSCTYLMKYVSDNPQPQYTSRLISNM